MTITVMPNVTLRKRYEKSIFSNKTTEKTWKYLEIEIHR